MLALNAEPMVAKCYRHQNPDLFGGTLDYADIPLTYNSTEHYVGSSPASLPESDRGLDGVRPITFWEEQDPVVANA